MILIPSLACSLKHGGDLRLMVSSFTVVQGPEPLFKFETKSLDNETTPPPCVSSFFLSLPYSMIYHFLGFFLFLSASEEE